MIIRYEIRIVTLLAAMGLLVGCQGEPATETEPVAVVPGSDIYESPGKPQTMPVDLKYRLLETPQVGQSFGIELTVVSSIDTPSLGFEVAPDDGLLVDSQSASFSTSSKPANSPETSVISVTPTREGRFHLRVTCNVMVNGQMQSRIVPIAIQVGQGTLQLEQMGEIKTDEDGNAIVSLPAETSGEERGN
ncbi:MAG: hypothetical protein QNJ11_02865 [Woeseiaceae bacterium]|nr:hypothetical protein [Woeseiaceae bacterium]